MKSLLWFDWGWWPMEMLTNVRNKCMVIISSPFRLAWQWQLLLQVLHSLVSVGLKLEHFQGFFQRRCCFWLHFINFISVAWLAFMFIGCHMMPMTTAEGHYGKMVTTELFGILFFWKCLGSGARFQGLCKWKQSCHGAHKFFHHRPI